MAPAYLLACLLLGGSAQGIWQNALLQIVGILIILWAALTEAGQSLPRPARPILLLAIAAIAIIALQAVPLPAALWEHGVRSRIFRDYAILGRTPPALPISLSPYASVSALLCVIPPLAIFCAIARLNAYRRSWLAAALLMGTLFGIVLGALQVVNVGPDSPWYLYRETNRGQGVGFFANANHMASLLLMAVPFVAALAAAGKNSNIQRYSALLTVLGALMLLLVVGLALNGSLAGFALAIPVLAGSAMIVIRRESAWRRWLAAIAGLTLAAAVVGLSSSSIGAAKVGQDAHTSFQSREQILETTARAIADAMPFGSGLGSFLEVYRLYESPDAVTAEYVVHAHNDYVEVALELGLAGILLIMLFFLSWTRAVWAVWLGREGGPFARAASIASAAVLIHSAVDFPLRTAAISAAFAMCLALMADRKVPPRRDQEDIRPTRHVVFR